ncbi:HhH-GPD family protein [Gryllotalpicola ginsengisoli]|uniref:A/G-specific adenine glycosylase n=1 Tax=Gryllotalpicola ginsengisoli TaxID=444608 RepID=UPI0003B7A30D|nr:A/G-specific adenine glycosylase [Gryllotalpicola ginsengisoli]
MPAPVSAGPEALAERVNGWFREHARELPWRESGCSPWGILVSEFMLQQTPVARVLPQWRAWLERWPRPADLAAVPPGEAVRAWNRLGYPRRALWLHACAVAITEMHGGEVPRDVDTLLALPGVGPYTARAVAAFAYGVRVPVVDTNVRRVIARAVNGHAEPGPPSTARDLAAMEALLPEHPLDARVFNAAAMELGAVACTARAPRCVDCPIADACAWRAAGYPAYDGPRRPVQKKYEGSDRHVRGLILRELRAAHAPVTDAGLEPLWDDRRQLARALDGLIADGLAVREGDGYALP